MKQVHLFGEMDLDLSLPANLVFAKAAHISEQCGYLTSWHGKEIHIRGEDSPDSISVINVLIPDESGRIVTVRKHVYRESTDQLIRMYEYKNGEWIDKPISS